MWEDLYWNSICLLALGPDLKPPLPEDLECWSRDLGSGPEDLWSVAGAEAGVRGLEEVAGVELARMAAWSA